MTQTPDPSDTPPADRATGPVVAPGGPAAPGQAPELIRVGEQFGHTVRYSREDIARVARETLDANPLHFDHQAAQRARHGEIIASGQHTASILMGLVASHFSRRDDGLAREMLCLNFNFAFKAPVFADQDLRLHWQVDRVTRNAKLGGWVGELSGHASIRAGHPCVVARGTVLVKHAAV